MADNTGRGRFVWHELMTPDTSGAHAFYSKVVGWKTQAFEHDPSYQMFAAGSGPIGGSVAQASGTPHWLHYVGTPDIEATVQAAKSRGASVTKEITAIPNGGKYAVLTRSAGCGDRRLSELATTQAKSRRRSAVSSPGTSWPTSDWHAAIDFYSAVFGWEKMAEHDMGPEMGKYVLFGSNGVQRGGMFNKPAEMPGGPGWLGYVRVKDVNDTVKKAKGARGTLVNGPMEVPGGDWIAQFVDPYGAMFAVHTLAADLKREPRRRALLRHRLQAAPAAEPAKPAAAPKKAAAAKKAPARRKAPAKKKALPRKRSSQEGGKEEAGCGQEREASGPQGCEEGAPQGGQEALRRQEESRQEGAQG